MPTNLFKYVTKDIFNLQRDEFKSNYADELDLCNECSMNTDRQRRTKCRCPKLERAIEKLNKYFFKRMNDENKKTSSDTKKFELIYKLPNADDDWDYHGEPPLVFLYLSPTAFEKKSGQKDLDDEDCGPYQTCQMINQVSVEDKLLFVDVMRFFGGFETEHEEPKVILYHCYEHKL